MAGRPRREAQGRSSRGDSSWPVPGAHSGAASGSAIATTIQPVSPASTPDLGTRATYRNLIIRGLAPDEAANMTAWLAGIEVGESHWTLRQINELLFLRQMNRSGAFTEPLDRTH
jgi:hypothetical protein